MIVTAVRVEELDQRIIANDLAGHDDPPRATASATSNSQFSGVQPCFRDEICWPRQLWARQ